MSVANSHINTRCQILECGILGHLNMEILMSFYYLQESVNIIWTFNGKVVNNIIKDLNQW